MTSPPSGPAGPQTAADASHDALVAKWRELQEARRLNDDFREALLKICQWADAYPIYVFPEPNWEVARQALANTGITLDSVSASNMRHVVTGVGKIARAALRDG